MRSPSVPNMSAVSLLGLAVGAAAGVAAALLVAPMRGADMRASLRSRADGAVDRGRRLLDEGRRAFRFDAAREDRGLTALSSGLSSPPSSRPSGEAFGATLGEIAQMHAQQDLPGNEERS